MATGDKLVNLDDLKTLKQYSDAQDSEIKSAFNYVIGVEQITNFTEGKGYNTSGGVGTQIDLANPSTSSNTICTYIECNEGDYFTCTCYGSNSYRSYAFLDAASKIIGTIPDAGYLQREVIQAPVGAKYVIFNGRKNSETYPNEIWKGVFTEKQNKLTFDDNPTSGSINPVKSNGIYKGINDLQKSFEIMNGISLITDIQEGKGFPTTGSTIDITDPVTASMNCTYAECSAGDEFTYTGYGSSSYRPWAFIDNESSGTIIGELPDAGYYNNVVIKAPENATHVIFNARVYQGKSYAIWKGSVKEESGNDSFRFCNMSLLGDSISAIEGYSTDGHKYYPNSNSDVQNVSEMWWKQVADYFGMTPLVIGGWSGSTVASGIRSESSYIPASDPYRCENLHSGTTSPDVVLIAMGVNDYSYDDSESEFGTWDGTTALGSESDLSDYATGDFKRAYATMLARIQHKYPNAFIICITPWFVERYDTDTGANFLNDIGKSIADYAEAVREICRIMHVTCINGTDIGFNRYNYYPTYCIDSATKPTHPNVAGQAQMAKAIIEQMKNIHRLGS